MSNARRPRDDDGLFQSREIDAADCADAVAARHEGASLTDIARRYGVDRRRVRAHVRGACTHRDGPRHYLRDPAHRRVFDALLDAAVDYDGSWIGHVREIAAETPFDATTTGQVIRVFERDIDGIDRERWNGDQGPWEWAVDPTLSVAEVLE